MKCRWVAEDYECPKNPEDTNSCFVFCKSRREFIASQLETRKWT